MQEFPKTWKSSIETARAWLRDALAEEGGVCPCCDRQTRIDRRPLSPGMAHALVLLVQEFPVGQWADFGTFIKETSLKSIIDSRDWTRMHLWGLIERRSGKAEEEEKGDGTYRVTQRGYDFVHEKGTVPEYLNLYNKMKLSESKAQFGIREALGKLDYDKLMRSRQQLFGS